MGKDDGTKLKATDKQDSMELTLKGPPEKVREQARVIAGETPATNGDTKEVSQNGKLAEALKVSTHTAVVKRVRPRVFNNIRCNVEVARFDLPIKLHEIVDEVQGTYGGGTYRVAVVDESGETTVADNFTLDRDPVFPGSENDSDLLREIEKAAGGSPETATEQTAKSIEEQTQLMRKQLDHENALAALEELRDRRKSRAGNGPQNAALDEKIARLEKQAFDAEKKAIEAKYETQLQGTQRQLDELNRKLSEPKRDGESKDIMKMFMEMQQKSDEKFNQLIQQMQNSKTDQLIAEVRALKAAPAQQGNDVVAKIVEKSLDKFLNDDDDDPDDADDPDKPWYERLADKFLPDVLDLIKERGEKGKPMTKEEITQQINEAAKKAEDEAVAAAQKRIMTTSAPRLPVPAAQLPAETPPAAVAAAPAPPPVEPSKPPTVEEEIAQRCGHVMSLFSRELAVRAREWEWTYECWGQLPEAVLEKVFAAPDPAAMADAFVGVFPPEVIVELKKRLEEPKARAWTERGLKELKGWHAKSLENPEFDPTDDSEEEPSDAA
jgi:hypothetical protein